jgi:hypothetical protein
MDDSERSYGYSEDLYHGKRAEKSYEYGAEDPTGVEGHELSPEEEAMRIEGANRDEAEPVPDPDTRGYDHGRETASYGTVESFTWDIPGGDTAREAKASETRQRTDDREPGPDRQQEVASAPDEELATKPTR